MPSEKYHELCGQIFIVRRRHYWWLGAAVTLPVFFIALVAAPLQLDILYTALIALGIAGVGGALSYHFFHRLNALKELQDAQVKIDTLVDDHTRYVAAIPARLAQAEMALHMLAERFGVRADQIENWGGNLKMVKYNRLHATVDGRRLVSDYGSLHVNITHDDSVAVTSCLKGDRHPKPDAPVITEDGYVFNADDPPKPVEEFQPPQEPQQPLPL